MPRSLFLGVLLLSFCAACASEHQAASNPAGAGGGGQSAASGTGVGSGGSGGDACAVNEIELQLEEVDGALSQTVRIEHEAGAGELALDTGSALTFLYLGSDGPEYLPDAGEIRIGCERLRVPGRSFDGEIAPSGLPIVGVLGADFFVNTVSELDYARARIVRYQKGHEPRDDAALSPLPYEDVADHALVRVVLDGENLRLMLDTGSPDLLHVGVEGKPGDELVYGQDAEGNLFEMYAGSGLVEMAGEPPQRVPVLRAPEFPYFEATVQALGGDIQGLLGVSSFAGRRLVFRPDVGVIRLGPPPR